MGGRGWYEIQSHLYDERWIGFLREAIASTITAGDVVVDVGGGSGLLGLMAARFGAARVYCVENDEGFIQVIRENALRNDLARKIIPVHADATLCDLPEPVDVIISEATGAGFFYEPRLQIIENLRRFLKPAGVVIPIAIAGYVELIEAQEVLYGLKLTFDARFADLEFDRPLTNRVRYHSADFRQYVDPLIRGRGRVRAQQMGTANALRITYDIELAYGTRVREGAEFSLNPQVVFLPEPVEVIPEREYEIELRYQAGDSPLDCQIGVRPVWDAMSPAFRPPAPLPAATVARPVRGAPRPVRRAGRPVRGSTRAVRERGLPGQPVGNPHGGPAAGVWAVTSWSDSDGTLLARGGADGGIQIWNPDTGQAVGRPLLGHTAGVWALVTWRGRDGGWLLASAGDDGTIRVWDARSGKELGQPLKGHAGWVPGLAASPRADGSMVLLSCGVDATIRCWDIAGRSQLGAALRGHTGWVLAVTSCEVGDGVLLASGGADGLVRLWDVERGRQLGTPLAGHSGWIRALVTWQGPDRPVLISGGYDGTIRRWDPSTGSGVGEVIMGHPGRVGALVLWTTKTGDPRLASGGSDGLIRVWDPRTGEPAGEPLAGHATGVWAMTSWLDARGNARIASVGCDGLVRLWDPESGRSWQPSSPATG